MKLEITIAIRPRVESISSTDESHLTKKIQPKPPQLNILLFIPLYTIRSSTAGNEPIFFMIQHRSKKQYII